jgi:hypothetical protein
MSVITIESLLSLEKYAKERDAWRKKMIPYKRLRSVQIGEYVTLFFEDEQTIRYQIQEVLRIEKTFEEAGILDELESYGPLVPTGTNLKATMMIQYHDAGERAHALRQLIGIEDKTWVQAEGFEKVYAIADEDLVRENAEKTSAVHFLRFEFSPSMHQALGDGAALSVGINHPNYTFAVHPLSKDARDALVLDLY